MMQLQWISTTVKTDVFREYFCGFRVFLSFIRSQALKHVTRTGGEYLPTKLCLATEKAFKWRSTKKYSYLQTQNFPLRRLIRQMDVVWTSKYISYFWREQISVYNDFLRHAQWKWPYEPVCSHSIVWYGRYTSCFSKLFPLCACVTATT